MQTDGVAHFTRPSPEGLHGAGLTDGRPLNADERQRQILVRARADGRVQVGSLAADLAVAEETVRRDLRELVGRGVLQRVHGGAYPVESAGFESNLTHRSTSLVAEKRRIAVAAGGGQPRARTRPHPAGGTPPHRPGADP